MAQATIFDPSPGSARQADDRLMELLSYWSKKRDGKMMPPRASIDPVEIPRLLPHVVLTDVTPENRFRYRLVGTAIEDIVGMGLTGRFMDEVIINKPYLDYMTGLYQEVTTKRCPVFSESDFISSENELMRATQRLMLPLSNDGETVDVVISGQIFIDRNSDAPPPAEDEPFKGRIVLALPTT